ncbi:KilA-N domain-containing protein [Flavobacterium sp.]|uniref:KilA-N domain-containing protein n=1 Tax=Flavobacterium sp. TaxID=239 RepID=UPI0026300728|nr:KilA-N domain-containing protein [Flavobacterium sp.]
MKKLESKALEFIYQDVKIHFLLSQDENVMVNATEMAKAFGKRTDVFLKTDGVKQFINLFQQTPNGGRSEIRATENRGHVGIYFHRILAIKFAAWLDTEFEIWIYSKIDEILFGHYKQHWDNHIKQEDAKERMEKAKSKLLLEATQEDAIAYFEAEKEYKNAKNEKLKAIQSQYKLFENL